MKSIYKYKLNLAHTEVELPEGSKVVHFGMQRNELCMWVEQVVESNLEPISRSYWVIGTGHEIPNIDGLRHLGTALDGGFVWHLYGQQL